MEVKYGLGYQDYEDMINNDIFCEKALFLNLRCLTRMMARKSLRIL